MLNIQDVTVRFGPPGTPNAIEHVTLQVPDRKRTCIIGETGSGKSVLLLSILQMLPETATVTGSAILNGEDLLALSPKQMRKRRGKVIAYIPQGSGDGMNPLLTVGYQVGEPLMLHKKQGKKTAIDRAYAILKKFDIGQDERIVKAYPHMFSGGMRQRALIAMGVIADAEILFADEPTKGLDQSRIQRVVEGFHKLDGKTLLCVTHDLRFAHQIADYLSVMYASELIEFASGEEFFRKPLHPYSQALLAALPENGMKIQEGFAAPREDEIAGRGCHYAQRCPYANERCCMKPPLIEIQDRKVRCWLYAD